MKRILVISAILATLVGIVFLALTMGGGTVQGVGDPTTPTPTPPPACLVPVELDVAIVIDKTGSMDQQTGGKTRLQWAKEAATELVDGIAGGSSSHSLGLHHVEVITFDGNAAAIRVGPALGNSDADAVRAAIAGITMPTGDTYIAPGMQKATADLNAHVHGGTYGSYKVVVLLSDGRNFDSTESNPWPPTNCPLTHQRRANTVAAIPALHAAADTVYTVGVGDKFGLPESCYDKELDEDLLTQISKGPPGDYTRVTDASTLPDIYGEISQEVINICVNFSGHKYDDVDCDGPAGSESGLEGVDIVLLKDNGAGGWTEDDHIPSGSDGSFAFVNKPTGHYLVCEDITESPWSDRQQTHPQGPGSGLLEHSPYGWCYDVTLAEPGGNAGDLDFYNCVPPTVTPTPTKTFTPTPTKTFTPTPTKTFTPTPTKTFTPTPTKTFTPTPTNTNTPTPTNTNTPAPTTKPPSGDGGGPGHKHTATPKATATPTEVPPTATPLTQVSPIVRTPPPPAPLPEAVIAPSTGTGSGGDDTWTALAAMGLVLATIAAFAGLLLRSRAGAGRRNGDS